MRQEEPQVSNDHPEAGRSAPVPVPPAGDRAGRADVPEDALDDRGTFDDPSASDDKTDEREFHEPGPLPTTFGATTVADAVAASALASPRPEDQPDPRAERTAQPGDGAEDGEREGLRADPTAELHRRGTDPETDDARADADTSMRTVAPPGSTDGGPERRSDLTAAGGDPDAAAYGSATPGMVDPDAVSPDADPVLAPSGAGASLESAGTSRPAGSTVAAEPATLLDAETAQRFQDRWRDVQLRFVDDPQAAAGEAQSLVEEAIQALASALAAQKNALGGWQDAGSADTEQLRMAVRRYRDFLDRVLGR
ncbi:hypothetical protein [Micromonospora sp. U21]|uniref:hypothetical protein n=1 Tax=Micromonospora sp. U21 TaxID=2824899 RepID=UPI001B35A0C9|nr:hypothetical protein [Micromonospora sp. U21]MBQ0901846.1 hypothetical protein [Micromonospora sp. U21]